MSAATTSTSSSHVLCLSISESNIKSLQNEGCMNLHVNSNPSTCTSLRSATGIENKILKYTGADTARNLYR